jgi:hypothetical protein
MDTIKKKFSHELNRCLEIKYKKRLKNSEFATFYNLNFTRSITSETARKWLLGISVPNVSIMKDLTHWLDMDLSDLFNKEPIKNSSASKKKPHA